jgi:hypothetical protein
MTLKPGGTYRSRRAAHSARRRQDSTAAAASTPTVRRQQHIDGRFNPVEYAQYVDTWESTVPGGVQTPQRAQKAQKALKA